MRCTKRTRVTTSATTGTSMSDYRDPLWWGSRPHSYDAWRLESDAEGRGSAHGSTPEEQEMDAAAKRQEQEDVMEHDASAELDASLENIDRGLDALVAERDHLRAVNAELLAACTGMLALLESLERNGNTLTREGARNAIRLHRAVIAKAEGR